LLQNNEAKKWIYSQSVEGDAFKNGQAFIDRKIDLATDGTVLPAKLVEWVQSNVLKGQRVCYSAGTNYPSLFWNLERSSNVEYLPIRETDRYPNSNNKDTRYSKNEYIDWSNRSKTCDFLIAYGVQSEIRVLFGSYERVAEESVTDIWILRRMKQ